MVMNLVKKITRISSMRFIMQFNDGGDGVVDDDGHSLFNFIFFKYCQKDQMPSNKIAVVVIRAHFL